MTSRSIDRLKSIGDGLGPRQKQWAWFVGLWLGGLLSVGALASAVRWLMGVE